MESRAGSWIPSTAAGLLGKSSQLVLKDEESGTARSERYIVRLWARHLTLLRVAGDHHERGCCISCRYDHAAARTVRSYRLDRCQRVCTSFLCFRPHRQQPLRSFPHFRASARARRVMITCCRQAMVCPNLQGPTGSGTLWNIAPGRHIELTESSRCAPQLLSDLSTGCAPLHRRFHGSSNCRSSRPTAPEGASGPLDTDLCDCKKGEGGESRK